MKKSPKQILLEIEQQNGQEKRLKRRNVLNELRNRLDEWIDELDSRDKGPSGKEVTRIVDELESYLAQLRAGS